ncbi:septal ring lytic transglycosylase RlpA family protein [Chitinophaga filiformis]|uniref:Probable endolytic peptidoglycan transglycosylase RlpA n=1 Tax=Chitinophaga filiformis TaxID=104663 RepID=A0A1G7JFD9_CHIFI|nr:septal ring lytic transglycosylase RlpA family protein [Chitinophaga filiformis]SDF23657.1 rare lipoprotein A [Chitinophaga filiformis]
MITTNYTRLFVILLCSLLCFSSCSRKITENGKASYYADKFEGRKTASGETFHQNGLTAAHRTLPFGTKVKVINISNGKSVTVRVNDRGPFSQGRVIDLSRKAAKRIGMLSTGVAVVEIKYKKKKK